MADQQLRGNKIRVFNVRVRQYLRKHYKPSKEEYSAICIYCLTKINYRGNYHKLLVHLTIYHPELLTEEQKTDRNVHWAWDYLTLTSSGKVQCNICSKLCKSKKIDNLVGHLASHREHAIFDPDEVIYEDTYMYGASTSASGSMIVEDVECQEASIPIASNLTDDTDRTCVPNESATKTSEPPEHVMNNPLEDIENIDNIAIELPAELELYDTEEVAGREELHGREELPVGEEVPVREEVPIREAREMEELQVLLGQSSDETHNFYSPGRECEITYDLLKKE